MIVTKKINNNVAICRDGNQRELIAFGKGIGFPPTPYELTDLSKIDRTFYNVSSQYIPLLNDIPHEVIQFTARQMEEIWDRLPYATSSNLILTLADHIAFAIELTKRGIYIQMPSVYEMEMSYPAEIRAGRHLVAEIAREFKVKLPKGAVQGIAMHLINAQDTPDEEQDPDGIERQYDEILEQTTQIIEWELNTRVRRDTFNYARFATHVQYLLKRVFEKKHIDSSNLQMYQSMREEYPSVSACVDKIADYFRENGIKIHMEPRDEKILKNTVDFVSFSYYLSVCGTADPTVETGPGNILGGVPTVEDDYRIRYMNDHLVQVREAVNDDGTGTMARYKKKSFGWYRQVIQTNGRSLTAMQPNQ